MPRRPAKLLIEDDSTYLTIVHPYPLNTNLQLPTDRRGLALWLACCTGKPDVLRAMFHKPKAAGMIIVEVDREFERFEALLGLHSWSEFLLAPTEEEAGKSSKVFYCTYHNATAVRNAGWNRVEIEDHWFRQWRLDNDRIKHPYPKSRYCDVPRESKTGVPLCHRLPEHYFPIATPGRGPPVPQVSKFKKHNPPEHATVAMAMVTIFGPVASTVEGSATGTPHGATTGASGAVLVRDQFRANGEAAVEDNLWDGYNTPRPDPPTKVKNRGGDNWICCVHGDLCILGICMEHARFERDKRWQEECKERVENKRRWLERKDRNAWKREKKLAKAEGREIPDCNQPAGLVNGPRGARGSRTKGNGDDSHDHGSLRFRTKSPDPPPPSQLVSPSQDSEEECTQTVISAEVEGFPTSADIGREHEALSSSAQACDIGATDLGDTDGDGTETGIQWKCILERNKGKGKGRRKLR